MVFRKLEDKDWPQIEEIFKSEGYPVPNKLEGIVGVIGEEVVSLIGIEAIIRVDPAWVKKGYRGDWLCKKTIDELHKLLPKGLTYFSFTESTVGEKLAKKNEMTETPYKVWKKRL